MATMGGDHGRQIKLKRVQDEMTSAVARKDMGLVATLAAKFDEIDAMPAEPVRTMPHRTGRTIADAWNAGTLADRRAILDGWRSVYSVALVLRDGRVTARLDEVASAPEDETAQAA